MITQERLKEVLNYEPKTGIFRWHPSHGGKKMRGKIAGTVRKRDGYIVIMIDGQLHQAHRLAWLYARGEVPKYIDHKNTNVADNRIKNLRGATQSQNSYNTRKARGKVGVRGICARGDKFTAYVINNYKQIHLGTFDTLKKAVAARAVKLQELAGEFYPQ